MNSNAPDSEPYTESDAILYIFEGPADRTISPLEPHDILDYPHRPGTPRAKDNAPEEPSGQQQDEGEKKPEENDPETPR